MTKGGARRARTIRELAVDLDSNDDDAREAARQQLRDSFHRAFDRSGFDTQEALTVWLHVRRLLQNSEAFMRLCEKHRIDPDAYVADAFATVAFAELGNLLEANTRRSDGATKPCSDRVLPPQRQLLQEFGSIGTPAASRYAALYGRYPEVDPSSIRKYLKRAKNSRGP